MNLPDHIHPIAVEEALLNIGMTINEIRALTGNAAPQIIRTREELEALDPDTVVWPYGYYDPYAAERLLIVLDGPFNDPEETVIPLPIAVIRADALRRAARKALEDA